LIDAGYGNNSRFLKELETRKLRYIGGVAKNRKVIVPQKANEKRKEIRLDEIEKTWKSEALTAIKVKLEKPKTLWVATIQVEIYNWSGEKNSSNRHEYCGS
jgi:hypothetical protein